MTSYIQYDNPLVMIWRDVAVYDEETHIVINGRIVLQEIADQVNHVIIDSYNEIYSGSPSAGQFKVNYANSIIDFDSSENGNTVVAQYYKKGIILYPASHIWCQNTNPDVATTVQDMIDNYNQLNGTDLYDLFDPNTGHKHSGTAGDAPPITHIQARTDDTPDNLSEGCIWIRSDL